MLIHLGKVYLGQTDRLDVTSKGTPAVVYIERAYNGRDNELAPTDGPIFHITDNGRGTVVVLPAKDVDL